MKDTTKKTIAIVGGGPAGAYLGYCLAKNGLHPVIFDDSHPREKPCGGGISVLAIEKFPILFGIPVPKAAGTSMLLISPKGVEIETSIEQESWTLPRETMDKFLLDKAVENGCTLTEEHVIDVQRDNSTWMIRTNRNDYNAEVIIGADGINSVVRKKLCGPIPKQHIGVCYGCFATSDRIETVVMKFLSDIPGYAWCFPRHDHLSIGVGAFSEDRKHIKELFHQFLQEYYPHVKIISNWGALIPNVKDPAFFNQPCCGDNWILIGDAAGHVDPTTGEGITYALWGAELAAQAILEQNPRSFDERWRKEYGKSLIESCKSRDLVYNPFILENTLRLASRSDTLSTFLNRLISNEIQQQNLMRELVKEIPKIGYEYILSKVRD